MDKTVEEQIKGLEKQLRDLKLSLGLDDFSSKIYHSKDEYFKPPASLVMQGQYVNRKNTATISIASPGLVTSVAHGLLTSQAFQFSTTGALPTGITAGTTYYVSVAGFTANTFQFSATPFGLDITTSGTQSGVHSINSVQFQGAKLLFVNIGSPDTPYGGIRAVPNEEQGNSGFTEIDFTHPTGEIGIALGGYEVGGGGREITLFVGDLSWFKVVDSDGAGDNYIETNLLIDLTGRVADPIIAVLPDATAAGAYAGRIAIDVGGNTKYLHYFDA